MTASANPMGGLLNPMANPGVATNSDFVSQMLHVSRQQALAQELMQQGIAPISYDPKGKISPLQGMSKMLAAALGGYEGNQAQQGQADLMSQGAQAAMAQYGGGAPAQGPTIQPAQPSAATQALGAGAATGSVGPTVSNAQRLAQALQGQPAAAPQGPQAPLAGPQGWRYTGPGAVAPTAMNPSGLPPTLLFAAASGNPAAKAQVDAYTNAAGKNLELTPDQKNWLATGADPAAIGAATNRKAALEGRGNELTTLQYQLSQLPPGSPQAQEIQAAIAKANNVPMQLLKKGELALAGTGNHAPIAFNPDVEANQTPTFSTNALGQTMPTGVTTLPGAVQTTQDIARAKAQGGAAGQIYQNVPNGKGLLDTGYGFDLFGNPPPPGGVPPSAPQLPSNPQVAATRAGLNALNPPIQQAARDAAALKIAEDELATTPPGAQRDQLVASIASLKAGKGPVLPTVGSVPQNLAPSATQVRSGPDLRAGSSDSAINTAAGTTLAALPQQAQQAQQVRSGLEKALVSLQGTKSGPGTASAFDMAGLLKNLNLPVAQDQMENYTTLRKFLANAAALNASASGNATTDARFDQFMHGQPNAETMTGKPLEAAIRYVLSQVDAVPAANQVIGQEYQRLRQAGDPNAAYNAQQAWTKQYPAMQKIFEFNRMSPDDQQRFKSQMPAGARDEFGAKYNAAHAAGWVQ